MNKTFTSFISILLIISISFSTETWSQKKNKSSLEIILSDHGHFRINVNDRQFDEVNKKIYLNDIPSGKIYLEVIKICSDNSELFCNQKVFYGYINLTKGKHHQAVVLVGEEEIVISDKNNLYDNNLDLNSAPHTDVQVDQKLPTEIVMEHRNNLPNFWKGIYENVSQRESDKEKIQIINLAIQQNKSILVEEFLPLISTLLFDDSKTELLNHNYKFITNKNKISLLKNAYTVESNFTEAMQSLK